MMKNKTVILFSLLVLCFQASAQTVIDGGNVSGKWTKANSPYQVNGDIKVIAGTTLEIEPGVVVDFRGGELLIEGKLLAEGTPNDNIILRLWTGLVFNTILEDESIIKYAVISSTNSNSIGVSIRNGNVTLTHNTIHYNGGGVSIGGNGNVILTNNIITNNRRGVYIAYANGNVTLTDNIISNNTLSPSYSITSASLYGGGIYIANGNVTLTDNIISNNTLSTSYGITSASLYGGGIYIANGNVTLTDNIISNNTFSTYYGTTSSLFGGGICIAGGSVTFTNNTVSNNNGGIYVTNNAIVSINGNTIKHNAHSGNYGGGIYLENSTANVYNNVISDNSAKSFGGGMYVKNMASNIYNNIISNNKHAAKATGAGGGICLVNSNSVIVNNTIVYNDTEKGGGIYCSNGSSPAVINNIIYGNTTGLFGGQVYIADNTSAPKMLYNLNQRNSVESPLGVIYNWEANYDKSNFDANPQFINYALQNYRLRPNSPCINAGIEDVWGLDLPDVDMDGNIRVYDGRIDIGAYEYGALQVGTNIENVITQQSLTLYPNPASDFLFIQSESPIEKVEIYNQLGACVLKNTNVINKVTISNLSDGLYLVRIYTNGTTVTGKIIVKK
jgi:parallel beta-helix repeat protein